MLYQGPLSIDVPGSTHVIDASEMCDARVQIENNALIKT